MTNEQIYYLSYIAQTIDEYRDAFDRNFLTLPQNKQIAMINEFKRIFQNTNYDLEEINDNE